MSNCPFQLILTVDEKATADPLQVAASAPGQFWSPAVPADLISCEPVADSLHSCRSPPELQSCKQVKQIQVLLFPSLVSSDLRSWAGLHASPNEKMQVKQTEISCEPVFSCGSSHTIIASPAKDRHTGETFFWIKPQVQCLWSSLSHDAKEEQISSPIAIERYEWPSISGREAHLFHKIFESELTNVS